MTRAAAIRQGDIARVLRAAKREGYAHPTVEICPDGTLRLLTAETGAAPVSIGAIGSWADLAGETEISGAKRA